MEPMGSHDADGVVSDPTVEEPRPVDELRWPTEPPASSPWGAEVAPPASTGAPWGQRPPVALGDTPPPAPASWPSLQLPPEPKAAPVTAGRAAALGGALGAVIAAIVAVSMVLLLTDRGSDRIVTRSGAPTATVGRTSTGGADIQGILAKVQESVVTIETSQSTSQGVFRGAGSGIVLSEDGLVLTNNHVVEGSGDITVVMFDGSTHPATLVGSFPDDDIAVIKLDGVSGLVPAELGSSADLKVGDEAIAIGNALNLGGQPSVTLGIISALDRSIDAPEESLQGLIQTDAAINPGNSGGPLVNADGQVVGVNTAIINDAQNIGFAIAIDTAKPLIDEIKAGKGAITPDTAFLGVSTSDVSAVTEAVRSRFGIKADSGAFVEEVQHGSAADQGGLEVGDVIVGYDGKDIKTPSDVQTAVRSKKAGDKIELRVEHAGEERTVTVTLGRKGG
jgi:putative serine protease PepD